MAQRQSDVPARLLNAEEVPSGQACLQKCQESAASFFLVSSNHLRRSFSSFSPWPWVQTSAVLLERDRRQKVGPRMVEHPHSRHYLLVGTHLHLSSPLSCLVVGVWLEPELQLHW